MVGKSDGHKFYVHNTYPGFMDTDKLIGKLTESMDLEGSSAMRKSTIRHQGFLSFSLPTPPLPSLSDNELVCNFYGLLGACSSRVLSEHFAQEASGWWRGWHLQLHALVAVLYPRLRPSHYHLNA
jgi:hypothetical protein